MTATNLEGRVVVVTGATGRLGAPMVQYFAKAGARVAAIARNAESISLPDAGTARGFSANVTKADDVERCFAEIRDTLGAPDVLVHTVGMWAGQSLVDTSLADWQRVMDINLTSTFLCFREAARLMQGRGGRLIAIASAQGADKGRGEQYAYSAAKAGVVRLVEAVAEEFAGQGITAHAIAPSTIVFDDDSNEDGVPVDDIVNLALYVAGDGASLNGATIRAYGSMR